MNEMMTLTRTRRRRTLPAMPGNVLSVAETAERYGVSKARVYQWHKAGLPAAPESPRDLNGEIMKLYFRVADIEAWQATQRKPGQRGPDKGPDRRRRTPPVPPG